MKYSKVESNRLNLYPSFSKVEGKSIANSYPSHSFRLAFAASLLAFNATSSKVDRSRLNFHPVKTDTTARSSLASKKAVLSMTQVLSVKNKITTETPMLFDIQIIGLEQEGPSIRRLYGKN
jgi:flagellar hook-basal body complex protein FliE